MLPACQGNGDWWYWVLHEAAFSHFWRGFKLQQQQGLRKRW